MVAAADAHRLRRRSATTGNRDVVGAGPCPFAITGRSGIVLRRHGDFTGVRDGVVVRKECLNLAGIFQSGRVRVGETVVLIREVCGPIGGLHDIAAVDGEVALIESDAVVVAGGVSGGKYVLVCSDSLNFCVGADIGDRSEVVGVDQTLHCASKRRVCLSVGLLGVVDGNGERFRSDGEQCRVVGDGIVALGDISGGHDDVLTDIVAGFAGDGVVRDEVFAFEYARDRGGKRRIGLAIDLALRICIDKDGCWEDSQFADPEGSDVGEVTCHIITVRVEDLERGHRIQGLLALAGNHIRHRAVGGGCPGEA